LDIRSKAWHRVESDGSIIRESNIENDDFEEWLAAYETELREGVQKRFGLADVNSHKSRSSDESLPDKDQGTLPTS
jgi:hypothetical protein